MKNSYFEFMNDMQELVLIEEPDSTIKYTNKAFCKFYGKNIESVVGQKLLDFIVPEDRPGCNMENVVSPENPEYRVVGRTIKANGEIAWMQFVGRGHFDENGKLTEFQEVGIDISQWKEKIEDKVKRLEKINRNLAGGGAAYSASVKNENAGRHLGNIAIYTFEDMITRNVKMQKMLQQAKQIAQSNLPVLIEGESGTGKELLAQAIHNSSKRANGPFVALNCGAMSPELLQSELFGYVEGAFTGAKKGGHRGKFEMANAGTIFLDEIGEMPLDQQVALLRILETEQVTRMGDNQILPVNVRVICATNKDLYEEMRGKRFRADLYFRLNVINLQIPPLRERKDDIYPLVRHIAEKSQKKEAIDALFSEEQYNLLYQYDWPGNIRELRNIVERKLYMPDYDLQQLITNGNRREEETNSRMNANIPFPSEAEKIDAKLADCRGNVTIAAKELGISRNTLYKKIKKYGIVIRRG